MSEPIPAALLNAAECRDHEASQPVRAGIAWLMEHRSPDTQDPQPARPVRVVDDAYGFSRWYRPGCVTIACSSGQRHRPTDPPPLDPNRSLVRKLTDELFARSRTWLDRQGD